MIKNYHAWILSGALVVAVLLSGCEKNHQKGTPGWEVDQSSHVNGSVKPHISDIADKNSEVTKSPTDLALENYINAEDQIATMENVAQQPLDAILTSYKNQSIAQAKEGVPASYSTKFSVSEMQQVVNHLKRATSVDLGGPYADLAQAGKNFEAKSEAFLKTMQEMDSYLNSHAYDKDGFAKGRELDPIFVAQGQAFIDAYQAFRRASAQVDTYQNDALVAKLKRDGEMRKAYGYQAYGYALRFLNLATSDDPKNPAVAESLDQQIQSMNQILVEMRKENDKVRDIRSPKFGSAEEQLTDLLAVMQDAKRRGFETWTIKRFVQQYNRFVKDVVDIGVLG